MGRIIVVGTPKSHVDLLTELSENDEYYAKKYPSEIENKPLWPQKYTCGPVDEFDKRSLQKVRKELGELSYMQEYLLVPVSSANSIFPVEMIMKCINSEDTFLPFGKIGDKYYVGCDMAITAGGDYTVYTVISSNADGKKVVYAERFRDNFEEQKKRLMKIQEKFRPVKICIDKTGLGEQIFRDMQLTVRGIEPVHFTYDEKFKLIMDLRHELETFSLSLPNSKNDGSYSFTQELVKELSDFILKVDIENRTKTKTKFGSGKYDDCVISLALANRASLNNYGSVSITNF
jgi:phage FluMu gp28-like protein